MFGSHDMRHTGFRRLTMVNGTPRFRGVTGFYGYIENIGKISVDIFTKISGKRKLYKIYKNTSYKF